MMQWRKLSTDELLVELRAAHDGHDKATTPDSPVQSLLYALRRAIEEIEELCRRIDHMMALAGKVSVGPSYSDIAKEARHDLPVDTCATDLRLHCTVCGGRAPCRRHGEVVHWTCSNRNDGHGWVWWLMMDQNRSTAVRLLEKEHWSANTAPADRTVYAKSKAISYGGSIALSNG